MSKMAHSLILASAVTVLSASPTTAISGSANCGPSEQADLRAYFHSAEFNVVDEMSVYQRDLSAYGTPHPAGGTNEKVPVVRQSNRDVPPARAGTQKVDLPALRAYFHSGAFDSTDGLIAYGGE